MWGPGVAPNGDKTDEMLPMNPEGDEVDVSQGVGVSTTTYTKPLQYAPHSLPLVSSRPQSCTFL